jgi:hypothetical protein
MSDDHIIAFCKAALSVLLKHADGDTNAAGTPWVCKNSVPHLRLRVVDSAYNGAPQTLFKAVIEVPYCLRTVLTTITDLQRRLTWDRNIAGLGVTVVREVGAGEGGMPPPRFCLFHSATKAVGPISGRDFVDAVFIGPISALPPEIVAQAPKAIAPGAWVNGGCGLPEGSDKYPGSSLVRGLNAPSGWVLEPSSAPADAGAAPLPAGHDGWTRISYVVQSDLKGWMPSMVVNASLTGMFTDFFTDLLSFMAKEIKAKA